MEDKRESLRWLKESIIEKLQSKELVSDFQKLFNEQLYWRREIIYYFLLTREQRKYIWINQSTLKEISIVLDIKTHGNSERSFTETKQSIKS